MEQKIESKIKEKVHFKSTAEQKVKELECKIKEKRQSETMLEQKVKKLESKLQEAREQLDPMLLLNSVDALRITTPTRRKAFPKLSVFSSEVGSPNIATSMGRGMRFL